MSNPVKISAFDRLKSLPEVFTLSTALRVLDMNAASLRVLLFRWEKSGMIEYAGPVAGIYYNLVVNKHSPGDNLSRVILTLYPEALLSEASVLQSAGWATQIPQKVQVNVLSSRNQSYISLHGVELHPRPKSWFIKMHEMDATVSPKKAAKMGFASYGLKSLKPEWALADMYTHKGCWKPDSDDLDIPEDKVHLVTEALSILSGLDINQDECDIDDIIDSMKHYSKVDGRTKNGRNIKKSTLLLG